MIKAISGVAAVVVASALLIPTMSHAATEPLASDADTLSTSVSYADLNLSWTGDVKVLNRRIDSAARGLCGRPYAFEFLENAERRKCIDAAVASAQPGVEAALGAARHGVVTVGYGATLIVTAPRR